MTPCTSFVSLICRRAASERRQRTRWKSWPLSGVRPYGAQSKLRFRKRGCRCVRFARTMIAELVQDAEELSNSALLEKIIHGTKYVEMLQEEGTEESESRVENIRELLTAAEESHERGEKLREFLDHAALVSDQDAYDE